MLSCPNRNDICDGTCSDCPKRISTIVKRYVFLDIDGVINSNEYFDSDDSPSSQLRGVTAPTELELGAAYISRALVSRLNKLVVDGVHFVLSSAWRKMGPVHDVQRMLWMRGFTGTLIGATPSIEGPRGREIASWLEAETGVEWSRGELAWPVFVILDDRDDMEHLRGRLVRTDVSVGLQDEHIQRAKRMLGIKDTV